MYPERHEWTFQEIRKLTERLFGIRPCLRQMKLAKSVYEGKDAVAALPTGAGKTLSFWIRLFMADEDARRNNKPANKMAAVITPLSLLSKQIRDRLAKQTSLQ
jgi:superfamily II DNA/RNA helicase